MRNKLRLPLFFSISNFKEKITDGFNSLITKVTAFLFKLFIQGKNIWLRIRMSTSSLAHSLHIHLPFYITTRRILGVLLIVLGSCSLVIFVLSTQKPPLIKETVMTEPIIAGEAYKKNTNESQVVRVLIPRLAIDLDVLPAKIVNGYWETSETTASHGEQTANPGEKSNVVIFAHAREGLFYNLKDAKTDDVIYVFTNNKWFRYKINEIKTVYPNQIEVVKPTNFETLTLFTCSGFFDEKRLVVIAKPIK